MVIKHDKKTIFGKRHQLPLGVTYFTEIILSRTRKRHQLPLGVNYFTEITLSCTISKINTFYEEIQDGRQKWPVNDF